MLTAEVRSADRTLLEVGAPPRLHRQLAAIRALLLCGVAASLALVIGTFALSAVTRTGFSSSVSERVAFPTATTVAVTLLVPVAAALLTVLTGQIREQTRKTDRSVGSWAWSRRRW